MKIKKNKFKENEIMNKDEEYDQKVEEEETQTLDEKAKYFLKFSNENLLSLEPDLKKNIPKRIKDNILKEETRKMKHIIPLKENNTVNKENENFLNELLSLNYSPSLNFSSDEEKDNILENKNEKIIEKNIQNNNSENEDKIILNDDRIDFEKIKKRKIKFKKIIEKKDEESEISEEKDEESEINKETKDEESEINKEKNDRYEKWQKYIDKKENSKKIKRKKRINYENWSKFM
jgi:hypothetical protein